MTLSLKTLQQENAEWSDHNFPGKIWQDPLLGMVEELGELSHHLLKQKQGIRGTSEEHEEGAKDAVGDIVVYLSDLCNQRGWDLEELISTVWIKVVKKRDWVKDPQRGVVATEAIQHRHRDLGDETREGGGPNTD